MGRSVHQSIKSESRRWRGSWILLCLVAANVGLDNCPLATAMSDKQAEATQVFAKADQLEDFRSAGSPPIRVKQKFSVWTREQGSIEGTDTLIWADADRWRETFQLPDYSELRVGGHSSVWLAPSQPAPTLAAWKARPFVRFHKPSDYLRNATVHDVRVMQVGGTTEKRVSLSVKEAYSSTYCFDLDSGYLLSSTTKEPHGEKRVEWSDFLTISGHQIPRHNREFFDGKLIGQTEITEVSVPASVEPNSFLPPEGAEEAVTCDDPIRPKPIRKPEPSYTPEARAHHLQGTVTLYLKVDRHGDVPVVGILVPLDPGLDAKTMKTIKEKWKFKPATCGGTPIPVELEVETSFKLE